MRRLDGRLVLSATDLTKHIACPHVTTLDLRELDGVGDARPAGPDDALDLVVAKGLAHERDYLAQLEAQGRRITRVGGADLAEAARATEAALAGGADVVYQAALVRGSWSGYADFLLRRESPGSPSGYGPWRYDVADSKLARRLAVPALIQMATYAEHLTAMQDLVPDLIVVTGDGAEHRWAPHQVRSYARRMAARLAEAIRRGQPTVPAPCAHCARCRWAQACTAEWEAADDVGLVAGIRADQRRALREAGVRTLAALAADPGDAKGPSGRALGPAAAHGLVTQARLQVRERAQGEPVYELLDPGRVGPGRGLGLLPEPDPADVYLDFEGDPFAGDGGREYLAGLGDRDGAYTAWWAHDRREERDLVARLVDTLVERARANPAMHVYHYAPYERAALARLTARHATGEAGLDELLRGGRLVDLYAVVRQGLRTSRPSLSLKQLEAFYWRGGRGGGAGEVATAVDSVVEYERYLVEQDPVILAAIEAYNRQDVRSTLALHEWLEERRAELAAAGAQIPRVASDPRGASAPEAAPQAAAEEAEESSLAERLRAAGEPLLAACMSWHRREARPQWWEFFRYASLSDDELVADPHALGGLGAPEQTGVVRGRTGRVTSRIWRYPLPPQDYSGPTGHALPCVDTRAGIGTLLGLDLAAGWAEFSRKASLDPVPARAAGVPTPVDDAVLRAAVRRVAQDRLAGGSPLGARLVARRVPAPEVLARRPGESAGDVVARVGRGLAGQVLAVQGPPGTGKTTAASRLVRALLDDGRTVGVTGLSHAVITNLLDAVGRPAWQKVTGTPQGDRRGEVRLAGDNAAIAAALADGRARLVGGTVWLWARPELAGSVDVLVVDEAGQFSLANAVAVAAAARSLVLLGDPQQLTQPTRAAHPDGGGVSALQHLIGDHDTIAADAGVFLDTTWRMHPDLAGFVSQLSYEGRLASLPDRAVQAVAAPGRLTGAGLRWIPVAHEGNAADSPQEAAVVRRLVEDLRAGRWTGPDGDSQPLTLDDILVVAPFNAHVARLLAALPPGARVGTVDRFQGQEAPVVLYSMASSSAELAPRGVGFLYDLHRLNVALSRARALAAVVASPALLDAAVTTPEQLRQVNALCRVAEVGSAAGRASCPAH